MAFTTLCPYCFTTYTCTHPAKTALKCSNCQNDFPALPYLGRKEASVLGIMTGFAGVGDAFFGEKCPACGKRGATQLGSRKDYDDISRGVRTERFVLYFACKACETTFSRLTVTRTDVL